jgi:hypothetical protein
MEQTMDAQSNNDARASLASNISHPDLAEFVRGTPPAPGPLKKPSAASFIPDNLKDLLAMEAAGYNPEQLTAATNAICSKKVSAATFARHFTAEKNRAPANKVAERKKRTTTDSNGGNKETRKQGEPPSQSGVVAEEVEAGESGEKTPPNIGATESVKPDAREPDPAASDAEDGMFQPHFKGDR